MDTSRKQRSWLRLAALAAAVGLFAAGCANFYFRTPKEFDGKKTVEDPPLSSVPAAREKGTA